MQNSLLRLVSYQGPELIASESPLSNADFDHLVVVGAENKSGGVVVLSELAGPNQRMSGGKPPLMYDRLPAGRCSHI